MKEALGHLLHLAWRDTWHERWLSLCTACVLAAALAPLWTLLGLERGVVGTLIERQNRDPSMRLVLPESTGAHRFDVRWFERVRSWPETAYAVPEVRAIAAQVDLFTEKAAAPLRAELLATSAGDPLLYDFVTPPGAGLVLTSSAARRLGVGQAGAGVTMLLERERGGVSERTQVRLAVAGILPETGYDRPAALAPVALLRDVEAWRDGYLVGHFGPAGDVPPPRVESWPRFRAYAHSIHDVEAMVARFEGEGVAVHARTREIAGVLGLQRNLRAVLAMIAVVTAVGAATALIAIQFANVQRKKRIYALLQLIGHGRAWLVVFPSVNATLVAAAGALLGFALYLGTAAAINAYFAAHIGAGEAAVRLAARDVAAGVAGCWFLSLLPALWGGWRSSNMEVADVLREE